MQNAVNEVVLCALRRKRTFDRHCEVLKPRNTLRGMLWLVRAELSHVITIRTLPIELLPRSLRFDELVTGKYSFQISLAVRTWQLRVKEQLEADGC
jgi:hypothetical protein